MKQYTVEYREHSGADVKQIIVQARTTAEAYEAAMNALHWCPYSAWVARYTTQAGKVHHFNNFEGKPY